MPAPAHIHTIGVISDTHGLVRPEVQHALAGVDLIVHAGDVGKPEVLYALAAIAPVVAVRGNVDSGAWAAVLPKTEIVQTSGQPLYLLHNLDWLDIDPVAAGVGAVICGHSHLPKIERRQGVLYLNPGSAGPRRFTLPVGLARLHVNGNGFEPELVEFDV